MMPLPLTVCCFSKIQIGFTFLVPAHPGSPRQRAVNRVCVCSDKSLPSDSVKNSIWPLKTCYNHPKSEVCHTQ